MELKFARQINTYFCKTMSTANYKSVFEALQALLNDSKPFVISGLKKCCELLRQRFDHYDWVGFYFADFSPGAITGVLLYLPINFLIFKAAFKEGFIKSYLELFFLFLAGVTCFALFEIIGPQVIAYTVLMTPIYYIMINRIENKETA